MFLTGLREMILKTKMCASQLESLGGMLNSWVGKNWWLIIAVKWGAFCLVFLCPRRYYLGGILKCEYKLYMGYCSVQISVVTMWFWGEYTEHQNCGHTSPVQLFYKMHFYFAFFQECVPGYTWKVNIFLVLKMKNMQRASSILFYRYLSIFWNIWSLALKPGYLLFQTLVLHRHLFLFVGALFIFFPLSGE